MIYLAETTKVDPLLVKFTVATLTAIIGVLGMLWRMHVKSHSETIKRSEDFEKKHDDCIKRHDESNAKIMIMCGEIGELKGSQRGMTELSQEIIRAVRETV